MPEAVTLEGKKAAKAGIANLSWNKANGAAGYQIWMSEAKDGTYKVAKSVTDPSVTSYDVRGLSAGKTPTLKHVLTLRLTARRPWCLFECGFGSHELNKVSKYRKNHAYSPHPLGGLYDRG